MSSSSMVSQTGYYSIVFFPSMQKNWLLYHSVFGYGDFIVRMKVLYIYYALLMVLQTGYYSIVFCPSMQKNWLWYHSVYGYCDFVVRLKVLYILLYILLLESVGGLGSSKLTLFHFVAITGVVEPWKYEKLVRWVFPLKIGWWKQNRCSMPILKYQLFLISIH